MVRFWLIRNHTYLSIADSADDSKAVLYLQTHTSVKCITFKSSLLIVNQLNGKPAQTHNLLIPSS